MKWPLKVCGYEKFWNALINGGISTSTTTLALWAVSTTGAIPVPTETMIISAVTGVVTSFYAALGAYIARNSDIEPPADQEISE